MISNELQAELDAEFELEVEVIRRRLRGEPLPAPEDPGQIAINGFIEPALANAAAAVLYRTCAEINEPYDAERVARK